MKKIKMKIKILKQIIRQIDHINKIYKKNNGILGRQKNIENS